MPPEVAEVLRQLDWMQQERVWPNGLRYLWTDAFGVVLLVSLGEALGEDRYVERAEGSWRTWDASSAAHKAWPSGRGSANEQPDP